MNGTSERTRLTKFIVFYFHNHVEFTSSFLFLRKYKEEIYMNYVGVTWFNMCFSHVFFLNLIV